MLGPAVIVDWDGSSPRGRGKRTPWGEWAYALRLIPAWAGKTPRHHRTLGKQWAHPRVGGENQLGLRPESHAGGSSPRGRGKLKIVADVRRVVRLIPAWAGKTRPRRRGGEHPWAHPRVGGENAVTMGRTRVPAGSSPRGRGKRRAARLYDRLGGLIPAWAGKTWSHLSMSAPRSAHPRVGGENDVGDDGEVCRHGSSPRGRGKRLRTTQENHLFRLIPAWAGKTLRAYLVVGGRAAHPRVGGENWTNSTTLEYRSGSSPRGRGKLAARQLSGGGGRLIPAWAGKTRVALLYNIRYRAHPRVGGENEAVVIVSGGGAGSSPRGRGKRAPGGARRGLRRLIPAWAGKTLRWSPRPPARPAHPRVGGENSRSRRAKRAHCGSSPRGRGKPYSQVNVGPSTGLIPAWAGKTGAVVVSQSRNAAHPRVGGENLRAQNRPAYHSGSSPRGRGKPGAPPAQPGGRRLIPAWAGKTRHRCGSQVLAPAHPRVGGENRWTCGACRNVSGSSPRGRGKLAVVGLDSLDERLIPAWAGKTRLQARYASDRRAHPRVGGENRTVKETDE